MISECIIGLLSQNLHLHLQFGSCFMSRAIMTVLMYFCYVTVCCMWCEVYTSPLWLLCRFVWLLTNCFVCCADRQCLSTEHYSGSPVLANRTQTSLTLSLANLQSRCAHVTLPSTLYTIYYGRATDLCSTNIKYCSKIVSVLYWLLTCLLL